MAKWLLLLTMLLPRLANAGDGLDVRDWLSRPGVKLLAVEFYASWCGPCKKAVPQWKALHEKYRDHGLRLVVVSVQDPDGACVNPGWNPDDVICDSEGRLAEAWGVGDKLPAAFLWSWRGPLLVRKGHVGEVKRAAEQELARLPRVTLDEGIEVGVRELLRTEFSRTGKVDVVAGEAEKKALAAIRRKSYGPQFAVSSACKLRGRLAANSLVKASFVQAGKGKLLQVQLFSAETGCLGASAGVSWNVARPDLSVAEAVAELVNSLETIVEIPGSGQRSGDSRGGRPERQPWEVACQLRRVALKVEKKLEHIKYGMAQEGSPVIRGKRDRIDWFTRVNKENELLLTMTKRLTQICPACEDACETSAGKSTAFQPTIAKTDVSKVDALKKDLCRLYARTTVMSEEVFSGTLPGSWARLDLQFDVEFAGLTTASVQVSVCGRQRFLKSFGKKDSLPADWPARIQVYSHAEISGKRPCVSIKAEFVSGDSSKLSEAEVIVPLEFDFVTPVYFGRITVATVYFVPSQLHSAAGSSPVTAYLAIETAPFTKGAVEAIPVNGGFVALDQMRERIASQAPLSPCGFISAPAEVRDLGSFSDCGDSCLLGRATYTGMPRTEGKRVSPKVVALPTGLASLKKLRDHAYLCALALDERDRTMASALPHKGRIQVPPPLPKDVCSEALAEEAERASKDAATLSSATLARDDVNAWVRAGSVNRGIHSYWRWQKSLSRRFWALMSVGAPRASFYVQLLEALEPTVSPK